MASTLEAMATASTAQVPVGSIDVRLLDTAAIPAWDNFVLASPDGTVFHTTAWKRALEQTFGFESAYLYAERAGQITGVLPLFSVKNWVIGKCLLSTPFAVYGGVCADDEVSAALLVQRAKQQACEQRVMHLELRQRTGGISPGFHHNSLYTVFTTDLHSDPEIMLKRLPRDTRYMIRKAQKSGLDISSGLDQLNEFYDLFACSMQRLGTPVFPKAWFKNLIAEFPRNAELMTVRHHGKAVSSVFSLCFRDGIYPYYAGAGPQANALAANNFMYWELLKQSSARGLRHFDFGRSKKGTGAFAFKTQWNMTAATLNYQVYLVKRVTVPNFSPLNPKLRWATRVWQRLPLRATRWMGPRVVRWFP